VIGLGIGSVQFLQVQVLIFQKSIGIGIANTFKSIVNNPAGVLAGVTLLSTKRHRHVYILLSLVM